MPINQSLLPEFDMEMAKTRTTLERVPEDKFDWTPHPKSMKMGALAKHLTDMPGWFVPAIHQDVLDIAPNGVTPQPTPIHTRKELLDLFDKNVSAGRAALASATDDAHLMKPWSLQSNGTPLVTMPRVAVIRGLLLNHVIHHRAQLGVYLRLNDVPVPSIYGPSADENKF